MSATTTKTTVTITRKSPDSPFGISYKIDDDNVVLTAVKETSLLASTSIRPGYELISVNGTNLSERTVSDVKAILASIQSIDVVFEAKPITSPCKFVFPLQGLAKGTTYNKPPLPSLFVAQNVPDRKWERIFQAFFEEVLPELKIYLQMNNVFKKEMMKYKGEQMIKGGFGLGLERDHEKKVYMLTNQTAAVHGSAVLMASNVLARSNGLLNSHGVMAELILVDMELPQYSTKQQQGRNFVKLPVGLRFTSIDDY